MESDKNILMTRLLTRTPVKFAETYCIHDYRDDWFCRICGYRLPTRLRVLIRQELLE